MNKLKFTSRVICVKPDISGSGWIINRQGRLLSSAFAVVFILLFATCVFSQPVAGWPGKDILQGLNPPLLCEPRDMKNSLNRVSKTPGHYTKDEWRNLIDSLWGPGLPTATKLEIFDRFWNTIDSGYACFSNYPVNWDSLKILYRPEVAAGVSRGRFSAIMSHLYLTLRESHTEIYDIGVGGVSNINLLPGMPLLNITGWGFSGRFGAGLSPLPDSSLLVYDVIPNHPLGLQRGDIILGYDRIPWRILIRQLIEYELPLKSSWIGSSPSSYAHTLLICAGRNWHLFDTIDIVKYSGGDTLHLSTSPLINQNSQIVNTEQINIPGVPKPDYPTQMVTYGTVTGTNTGYIYVWGWINNAQQDFLNAVQALWQTNGLIIDFRFNIGGNMFYSNPGLSLLFDSAKTTIDFGVRCSPNHLEMCPGNNPGPYTIWGAPPGYNKPIAVLVGPGAVSSGDQVALRFKYHPRARFFGKSTSTAFNVPQDVNLNADWLFRFVVADAFKVSNPGNYLTHIEFPVDQNIWLTREKVVQGRDDVVEAAMEWINKPNGISGTGEEIPQKISLQQNYPNPFNPVTKIKFSLFPEGPVLIGLA